MYLQLGRLFEIGSKCNMDDVTDTHTHTHTHMHTHSGRINTTKLIVKSLHSGRKTTTLRPSNKDWPHTSLPMA